MSRTIVIGDVHSNLPALQAVIADAGEADAWLCIGDTVGYGPYPNESVRLVSGLEALAVAGNHDLGCTGVIPTWSFNPEARQACEWTGQALDRESRDYLLSIERRERGADFLLVHGSPMDPVWEYVLSSAAARANFGAFDQRLCFHGHTHVPAVFVLKEERAGAGAVELITPEDGRVIELQTGVRYMVNVGSVGQPRDGDPRACYVEYDEAGGVLTYRRVSYSVRDVQERMEEEGLPEFLARRLAIGR